MTKKDRSNAVPMILPGGYFLTAVPAPIIAPASSSPHILVIGAGITGLTTSWVLLDRGYRVTILSKAWADNTSNNRLTSQIAGALWEYPPAVCGSHTNETSLKRSKEWAMISYQAWKSLADGDVGKDVGVSMARSTFFFPYKVDDQEGQRRKMLETKGAGVTGFSHSASLIGEMGINPEVALKDAYELLAPVIDTDKAMFWFMSLVKAKGARFVTEEITADLYTIEADLRSRFDAHAIINCSGLASRVLASDKMCYPLRGGLLRYINDGSAIPKIQHAMAVSADVDGNGNIIFIVPRNDNILVVGGFAEPDQWDLKYTIDSPAVRDMRKRAVAFLPALKDAKLDPSYPLAQGLRPARHGNVRLERETRDMNSRIVHSYGHGGSGWSFSFGCAVEVAQLVEQMLSESESEARKLSRPAQL